MTPQDAVHIYRLDAFQLQGTRIALFRLGLSMS